MINCLKVGLTGGIGSGKSVVARIFSSLGVAVYDADSRAKALVNNDDLIRKKIVETMGEGAFDENGYNRSYVSNIVFKDKDKLQKLNQIIHPAVAMDFFDWTRGKKDQNYIIKEAALLFESGSYHDLDSVVLVTASIEQRKQWILKRDPHRSVKEIESIIDSQWGDDKKRKLSSHEIKNDLGSLLIPQVLALHEFFSSERTPV